MKRVYLPLLAIVLMLAIASVPRGLCYPPAGYDYIEDTTAIIDLQIFGPSGFTETITAKGPTNVSRSSPYNPGDGHWKIDTEIVYMNLVGFSTHLGSTITIVENSTSASTGAIRQITAGDDFPATSFFDVFVEIETTNGTFHNNEPVNMSTIIYSIPPWGANYRDTNTPIPLRDATGNIVGYILYCMHRIPAKGGGIVLPTDKFGLLAPYIGLTSTVLGVALATAIYVKRFKRKK